ncbi:MAG: ferrous iron transport protein A [Sinobacterium sp.]|nr:ferrous iron transport protein A [Sinobacterium sp.]
MTLNQLSAGQYANVIAVPTSKASLSHRCQTLGISEGSAIQMLRRAPGKGPLQVKVLNTLYSIRPDDAVHIQVSPL